MKKVREEVFGKPNSYSATVILDESNGAYFKAASSEELEERARETAFDWGYEYQGYKGLREYYLVDVGLIVDNRLVRIKANHLTHLYRYLRTHNVTRCIGNYSDFNTDYYFRVEDLLIMRGLKKRDPKRHKDWF